MRVPSRVRVLVAACILLLIYAFQPSRSPPPPLLLSDLPNLIAHIEKNLTYTAPNERPFRENEIILRQYAHCLEHPDECHPNFRHVVFFSQHWVKQAVLENWRGGEGVWGRAVYLSARSLGYTCLFGNSDWDYAYQIYQLLPINVIWQCDIAQCMFNASCAQTKTNPTGIPLWKMFDMSFFPLTEAYPVYTIGPEWTLNAEFPYDWPQNRYGATFMGYTLDNERVTPIPHNQRPQRAYILGKAVRYFHDCGWPLEFWSRLKEDLNIDLVAGFDMDNKHTAPPGITNLGSQSPEAFRDLVANSRVLIGLKDPKLSPSPWLAMAHGTPFLNPILSWHPDEPDKCSEWETQHDSLRCYAEPLVYNVKVPDYEAFRDAVKRAMETETPPFVPEYMTQEALTERVEAWVTGDWKGKAPKAMKAWRPYALDWVI